MRCRVSVKMGTSLAVLHRSSSYNLRALPDDVQNLRSIGPGRNKSVGSGQGGLYLPKRVLLLPLSHPFCCIAVLAPMFDLITPAYDGLAICPLHSRMGCQLPASLTPTLSCALLFVRLLYLVKHNRMLGIHVNNSPLPKHPIVRTTTFSQDSPIDPSRVPPR